MSNLPLIPISVGELADKYTILKIKQQQILDENKLQQVQNELNQISRYTDPFIKEYPFYVDQLYKINKEIWVDQDAFRIASKEDMSNLALSIIINNDARFRVKNKINLVTNSNIKEQKSYTLKKAFIFPHLGCGDMFTMISAIRYFSLFMYDEIKIVVLEKFLPIIQQIYKDDPTISFYPIQNVFMLCPNYGARIKNREELYRITQEGNYDLFLIGMHKLGFNYDWDNFVANSFYKQFYQDLGLDFSIFSKFNYINRNPERERELLKNAIPKEFQNNYIFTHDGCDNTKTFAIKAFDPKDMFVYDANKQYSEKFKWSGRLSDNIIDYSLLIENATEIHIVDSAFSCLSMKLNLSNVKRKVVYAKTKVDYTDYFEGWTIIPTL